MFSIYEPYIWRFGSIRTCVISGIVHRKSLRFRTVQLDMDLSTGLIWFPYNTSLLSGSQCVRRAAHTSTASAQHMRVNHRRSDILVPEKFLNGPNIIPGLKQVSGEGVTESVTPDMLNNSSLPGRFFNGSLKNGFMDVVAAFLAGLCTLPPFLLREHPLPPPVLRRVRILAVQGAGHHWAIISSSFLFSIFVFPLE